MLLYRNIFLCFAAILFSCCGDSRISVNQNGKDEISLSEGELQYSTDAISVVPSRLGRSAAPENVRVEPMGSQQLRISWNSVHGASFYRLYWSTVPGVARQQGSMIEVEGTHYTHGGLKNGVTYYYSVTASTEDRESAASHEVRSTPFLIVVYGDNQGSDEYQLEILPAMIKMEPNIAFHVGDIVNDGAHLDEWLVFNSVSQELFEIADFFPAMGNHDVSVSGLYYDNFELPHNEKWYSIDRYGIRFIVLNSNAYTIDWSEQDAWLTNELNTLGNDIQFVVVTYHHPLFNSAASMLGDNKELVESFVARFAEYNNVDLVFNGHVHAYEKLFYHGSHYIITGGAGGNLHDQDAPHQYSQLFIRKRHFCTLEIIDGKIVVTARDKDLGVLDEFEIE